MAILPAKYKVMRRVLFVLVDEAVSMATVHVGGIPWNTFYVHDWRHIHDRKYYVTAF